MGDFFLDINKKNLDEMESMPNLKIWLLKEID